MSDELRIQVGGDLASDLAEFASAWKLGEAGDLSVQRVLSFESWDSMSAVLTGERYRLLRHVHAHPERSVNALATALKRQYRRVHDDVRILERAGLLDRSHGDVRTTVDRLTTQVVL
jgi:predicted transcriptional regulator